MSLIITYVMVSIHMVGNTVLYKVCGLSALMSAFFFISLAIDTNVFELILYYVILGISTWSWMNHWDKVKPLVWITCTAICTITSVAIFKDYSIFAAIALSLISQAFVYLIDSLGGEI
ncbi:hypothetical protein Henu6_gp111 [Acinetobacter phage Henu6]|uniref:Uncharacterized protein n=2 Tax=Zedzedvirus zz1 TaxID=2843640 RepID=A0A410T5J8_9CAUD|nr:hypothetical protein Henu6_gp111 [Acinetobacter phage Henu6]